MNVTRDSRGNKLLDRRFGGNRLVCVLAGPFLLRDFLRVLGALELCVLPFQGLDSLLGAGQLGPYGIYGFAAALQRQLVLDVTVVVVKENTRRDRRTVTAGK